MQKFWQALVEIYRERTEGLGMFLNIIGVLLAILVVVFAHESVVLSLAGLALLALLLGAGLVLAVRRSKKTDKDQIVKAPSEVRKYRAVTYAASSDPDLKELNRFALAQFGETFPPDAIDTAVRNGGAFGLRLTDEQGQNLGFLDAFHFRADVLKEWREGRLDEKTVRAEHFVPVGSIANPAAHELELAVGAIFIKNSFANHYLAHALIEAGKDYLGYACRDFPRIRLYATIFSDSGLSWASKEDFQIDIAGRKRGPMGGGHPVYVGDFVPRGVTPRPCYSAYSRHSEYRVQLRM